MNTTYRLPYNLHRHIDQSDKPMRRYLCIQAPSYDEAIACAYNWRVLNQDGITTKLGRRYIGMIFVEANEEGKP